MEWEVSLSPYTAPAPRVWVTVPSPSVGNLCVCQSNTDYDSIPKLRLLLQQHARSCSMHDYENTAETVLQQCGDSFPLDCCDLLSRRFHNWRLSWQSAFTHSDWKQTEKTKLSQGGLKICSSNLIIPQHIVNLNISFPPASTIFLFSSDNQNVHSSDAPENCGAHPKISRSWSVLHHLLPHTLSMAYYIHI